MNAEIISVGTELLLGHTVNTDTTIIARELSALGIDLLFPARWATTQSACAPHCAKRSRAATS